MRRTTFLFALLLVLGSAVTICHAQPTIYVSPDVPTDPDPGPPPTYLPWDVIEHAHASAVPYTLHLTVPGTPAVDALHKMDTPGDWLFSIEAPDDLGGALPVVAEPRDVIRLGGGIPGLFFDGSCVGGVVPLSSGIDALYMDGGDTNGDLVVSFDVPTTILGGTYQPSALVRWARSGPLPCGWQFAGAVIDFAVIPGWTYFPASTNVIGVDHVAGRWVLAMDIPVDLAPPGAVTATPGQIVSTDGLTGWTLFDDLQIEGIPGWPISSLVDALSCQSNPGRIESPTLQIKMSKSLPQITVVCPPGCASGAEGYGVYEGTLANIQSGTYDHKRKNCSSVCPGNINFVPAAVSSYYLVVPHNTRCNTTEEGSYGTASGGAQRPQAALIVDRCATTQNLTPCP